MFAEKKKKKKKSTLKWSTDLHHKQKEFKSHNIDGAIITGINLTVISHLISSFGAQIPSSLIVKKKNNNIKSNQITYMEPLKVTHVTEFFEL